MSINFFVGLHEHVPLHGIRSEGREDNGGTVHGMAGQTYFHNLQHST